MADFLDEKRREISARLNELKPLVEEYERLEAAAAALDGVTSSSAAAAPSRRDSAHRQASRTRARGEHAAAKSSRRGRPKGTGTRAKQALEIVEAEPGITIPQIAQRMGIKQNYLYRVLPGLEQDGLIAKQGRGWHPKADA
jgi:transposase